MPFGFGRGRRPGSFGRGIGRGRGSGRGGPTPGGECVCPRCGHTVPHTLGTPCYKTICTRCGASMTRKFTDE